MAGGALVGIVICCGWMGLGEEGERSIRCLELILNIIIISSVTTITSIFTIIISMVITVYYTIIF